jgi:integral membrane protein
MNKLLQTSIGRFRIICFLEGLSYLVLLLIAMPLKYYAGNPEPVRIIGMAHGLLFILYVLLAVQVKIEHKWSILKFLLALLASLIPVGTFYFDRKYLSDKNFVD